MHNWTYFTEGLSDYNSFCWMDFHFMCYEPRIYELNSLNLIMENINIYYIFNICMYVLGMHQCRHWHLVSGRYCAHILVLAKIHWCHFIAFGLYPGDKHCDSEYRRVKEATDRQKDKWAIQGEKDSETGDPETTWPLWELINVLPESLGFWIQKAVYW